MHHTIYNLSAFSSSRYIFGKSFKYQRGREGGINFLLSDLDISFLFLNFEKQTNFSYRFVIKNIF